MLLIRIAKLKSAACIQRTQGRMWIRIFLDAPGTRRVAVLHWRRTARLHAARLLVVEAAPSRAGATGTTGNGSSEQEILAESHRTEKLRLYDRWQRAHAALSPPRNSAGTGFVTTVRSELTVVVSAQHLESSVRTVLPAVLILTAPATAALGRKVLPPHASAVATEL